MIKYEFIIFLGLGLVIGVYELVTIRRAVRRDREAALLTKTGPGAKHDRT